MGAEGWVRQFLNNKGSRITFPYTWSFLGGTVKKIYPVYCTIIVLQFKISTLVKTVAHADAASSPQISTSFISFMSLKPQFRPGGGKSIHQQSTLHKEKKQKLYNPALMHNF